MDGKKKKLRKKKEVGEKIYRRENGKNDDEKRSGKMRGKSKQESGKI